ncbi:hypothetical protein DSL72_006432 [Monilinia vaccinii-corymbosi]|uniref:Heterokaryon incompatibility domain-containing protein n=1 Tax=Monilinia vaccinii-corymbosi TaxID=61207 RepID=A0A8A3PM76_9HELO|nr:hypothetical protein DSL72_006432 [Monilinia vaccinii-corymbosi]
MLVRGLDGVIVGEEGAKTYKAEMVEMEREGTARGLDVEIQAEGKTGGYDGEEVETGLSYDRLAFYVRAKVGRCILVFWLQKRRGQIKRVEDLVIGHYALDPDLGSEANFEIARDWIQTCSSTHYECPVVEERPLPTRVIHVGSHAREPYLLTTNGMKGKYIALSHCWGGKIKDDSKLNKRTAKSFQTIISMVALPASFRDAILIARGLGFEFLWIDCLCILQDSSEDWEVESKNMGDVYRNATLTIAAAMASKCTDGILNTFSDYDLSGISISIKLCKDSGPEDRIDLVLRDKNREGLDHLLHEGPLVDRGWTLQEEILSARILYYGRMQIYWQCLHDHASADGLCSRAYIFKRTMRYSGIKDQIHVPQGLKNRHTIRSPHKFVHKDQTPSAAYERISQEIIEEYHKQMIVDYCSRRLTFARDKFPAFSGIVVLVRDILRASGYPDSMYIAGIWSSHFREGMVWYYGDDAIPEMKRGPTWSWAVINGKVIFHLSTFNRNPFRETPIDPKLVSHNVVLAGQNPYGEIHDASLEVLGCTMVARGMNRVHAHSMMCGYIHWDTRLTGKGRRKNALYVFRVGESVMFIFSPQNLTTPFPISRGIHREDMHKARKTRYKIMFVATQARQAHGLLLRQYEVAQDIEGNDENKERDENNADGEHRKSNVEAQPQPQSQTGNENGEKGREKPDDTGTGSSLSQYRRLGYVRLFAKHTNMHKSYDAYQWADLVGWKREKFMLI